MKKGWRITLGILLAMAVLIGGTLLIVGSQTRRLIALDYSSVIPAALADGTYTGQTKTLLTAAEIKVDILEGKLAAIRLIQHFYGKGMAAEAILDSMMAANRLDVDSISGATVSSLTIKAAVLNALAKGGPANE